MTVKELRKILKSCDPYAPVMVRCYGYSSSIPETTDINGVANPSSLIARNTIVIVADNL